MCKGKGCVSIVLLVFLSLLLGIANALLWYFGYIPFVRAMLPFALAFAIVILIVTAILKAKCGYSQGMAAEGCHVVKTCMSLRKYSPVILITATIFISFAILTLATYFSFTVRTILAFIGSISFWTMFFSFIAMISCISYRRR